jgi:hypothetical protein
MRSIETRFGGFRFRSRLEARWALFFNRMGLRFEYEPQGYHLEDGRMYLPDFKVYSYHNPDRWWWYEVKGGQDDGKFAEFLEGLSPEGYYTDGTMGGSLLEGDPMAYLDLVGFGECGGKATVCPRCGGIGPLDGGAEWLGRHGWAYVGCNACDNDTPDGGGHEPEKAKMMQVRPHKGVLCLEGSPVLFLRLICWSARLAREARFEHGQAPHFTEARA